MDRYFVEIDAEKYENYGEVHMIAPPIQWSSLCEREFAKVPRGGFEIHRKEILCSFVKAIGGQRGAVADFILRKKNGWGQLLLTTRELAAATGTSIGTVNTTMQDLQAAGCIRCRTGGVMLNPGVAHRGNRQREAFLLKLYGNFENRE